MLKEIHNKKIKALDPEFNIEIIQFLLLPFLTLSGYLIWSRHVEKYQIVIFIIISVLFLIEIVYDIIMQRFVVLSATSNQKFKLIIKSRFKTLLTMDDVQVSQLGWNYRINNSLSKVKLFSVTHRTNHNIVLIIEDATRKHKLTLVEKLPPWKDFPSQLKYVNDIIITENTYLSKGLLNLDQIINGASSSFK